MVRCRFESLEGVLIPTEPEATGRWKRLRDFDGVLVKWVLGYLGTEPGCVFGPSVIYSLLVAVKAKVVNELSV